MENRRILKFRTWPPSLKGLLYGGLVGCTTTLILQLLYVQLGFSGKEGVGILVGYVWSLLVNMPTAALYSMLGLEWNLGSLDKPNAVQFVIILAVNTSLGAAVGSALAWMKQQTFRHR